MAANVCPHHPDGYTTVAPAQLAVVEYNFSTAFLMLRSYDALRMDQVTANPDLSLIRPSTRRWLSLLQLAVEGVDLIGQGVEPSLFALKLA